MTKEEIRAKAAGMILDELKAGNRRWFYISMAGAEGFYGGAYINAFGFADANNLLHALTIYPVGASLETRGYELPLDVALQIPEGQKWRLLTREEVEGTA